MFDNSETTFNPQKWYQEIEPFNTFEDLISQNKVAAQNLFHGVMLNPNTARLDPVVDTLQAYRGDKESLKSIHRPINGSSFTYFGQEINVNGLEEKQKYTLTELTIGILALYSDNKPIGIINVHPDSVKWVENKPLVVELQDISNLEEISFCTTNKPNLTSQEILDFLSTYHGFFTDDTSNPNCIWNAWTFFNEGEYKPNTNYLPIQTQIYLWRYLYSESSSYTPQTAQDSSNTLNVFEVDAPWIISSLEGDHTLITKLTKTIQDLNQYLYKEKPPLSLHIADNANKFFKRISEVKKFIPEISHILTFNSEKQRIEAEQLVESLLKNIITEFITGLSSILSLDENKQPKNITKGQHIYEATFHYNESITSLLNLTRYIAQLYSKENIKKEEFFPEETKNMTIAASLFPKDVASHNLRRMEWLIRCMNNQSGESKEEVNEWLNNFYTHITQDKDKKADVYDEGAEIYTDHDRATTIMANGVAALAKNLPKDYNCALLGAGPGKVEKNILKKAESKNPQAKPGATIAFDILTQNPNQISQEMHHLQADTAHLPFANESIDLMLAVGSPLNNMRLVSVWVQYFIEITNKLSHNGYFMYEVGSLTPVKDINQRIKAAQKFHQYDNSNPFGAIEILQDYLQPGDNPGDVGAILFDHTIMDMLAQLAGLELVSPPKDKEKFAQMEQEIQDPDALINKDPKTHNPLEQPFWITPNDPTNARAVYVFQRKNQPHPLFEMFINHFIKRS